jgi:hypothetical protein
MDSWVAPHNIMFMLDKGTISVSEYKSNEVSPPMNE